MAEQTSREDDPKAIEQGDVTHAVEEGFREEEVQDEVPRPDQAVRPLTYAWDQSEDYIKVYVGFDQAEELAEGVSQDRVSVDFGEWNALVLIQPEAGNSKTPFGLRLGDFQRKVDPDRCSYAVHASRVTIRLRKQERDHWFNIVQRNRPDRR
mmetsp:Transcript_43583/g.100442  ORF Transcript_43583/g.100442 Transcript_43583/m.100442 type:complete len:152 (+) Transcript_43583:55-510(+)